MDEDSDERGAEKGHQRGGAATRELRRRNAGEGRCSWVVKGGFAGHPWSSSGGLQGQRFMYGEQRAQMGSIYGERQERLEGVLAGRACPPHMELGLSCAAVPVCV